MAARATEAATAIFIEDTQRPAGKPAPSSPPWGPPPRSRPPPSRLSAPALPAALFLGRCPSCLLALLLTDLCPLSKYGYEPCTRFCSENVEPVRCRARVLLALGGLACSPKAEGGWPDAAAQGSSSANNSFNSWITSFTLKTCRNHLLVRSLCRAGPETTLALHGPSRIPGSRRLHGLPGPGCHVETSASL